MKIIKKVLLILGILIAVILIVAALLPSTMSVERSIVINKPVGEVYPQVADLNNFVKWNPWAKMDTSAKIEVIGNVGVGQSYTWNGDVTGKGSMTTDSLIPNKLVSSTMKFIEPMESVSNATFKLEGNGNTTKVIWGFSGEAAYPHGRIFGLFVDKQLGGQFDQGLNDLKKRVEEGK